MLTADQARRLKAAGLDYDNRHLDTSPEFYGEIITTRRYEDRLKTLGYVRDAGISVCCGGILGMGEGVGDRIGMIAVLATLPKHSESWPSTACPSGGNAARGSRQDRSARFRAHDRGGAHCHAGIDGAAYRPPAGDER
jgi:biotin synthase